MIRRTSFTLLLTFALLFGALPTFAAPPRQPSTGAVHVVQPGESLSQIAELYRVPVADLMALNGIVDADAIYAGQSLLLPPGAAERAAQPTVAAESVAPADVVQVDPRYAGTDEPDAHIVQAGESLSQIALRYGIDMAELMDLNGIINPDAIYQGQKLRLTHVMSTGAAMAAPPQAEAPGPSPSAVNRAIATRNRTYRVQPGDDLTAIAVRHGVDSAALAAINGLSGPGVLALGQELILPATSLELQVERPRPATSQEEYIVQAGDSLGMIAERFGLTLAELMEANYIANPDTVYIGQRLLIPVEPDVTGDPAPSIADIGRPRSGFYYYTVKPGDTLSELAREFDTTVLAILEYNDLPDPETVYNGLALRIPYGPPPLPLHLPPIPLAGSRFMVSLSRQQCWVLSGDRVLHSWVCSTGYGQWITRTGSFTVQTKLEMAGSTMYELDMPYWLGIYDVGTYENGIHGLPIKWETGEKIWEGLLGQPATFGCAMLDDADAATLFDLAYLGMPVYIVP
ncbi:MAG: LysM peptidoglycan-binding domain-containing protein [Chloroflexota bacterium]|nr:LysM peptidoglycan-binding domain-containing protein [Chloroflexota bacterium]